MNLAAEVKTYIKHKRNIADNSTGPHYLNFQRMAALQRCWTLLNLFCYQLQYLTPHDVARFVLQSKQDLFTILPAEENKSYKSQLDKYNKIIEFAQNTLKPKNT